MSEKQVLTKLIVKYQACQIMMNELGEAIQLLINEAQKQVQKKKEA